MKSLFHLFLLPVLFIGINDITKEKTTLYYSEELFLIKVSCASRLADFESNSVVDQNEAGSTKHFIDTKSGLNFYTQALNPGETAGHDHFVYFGYLPVAGAQPNYSIKLSADKLCNAFGFKYNEYNGLVSKFIVIVHFQNDVSDEERKVYILSTEKNPPAGSFKFFGIKTTNPIQSVEILQTGNSTLMLNDVRF